MSVEPHSHDINDLPVGNGTGKIARSSSIRTGLIEVQSVNSGVVANLDVLTYFTGSGPYTLPANTLRAGEVLRVSIMGTFTLTGTPSLTIVLGVGGVARATHGSPLNEATATDGTWSLELEITQLAAGAARMRTTAYISTTPSNGVQYTYYDVQGMDPTVDNVITVGAGWSVADASNSTVQVYRSVSRAAIYSSAA